MNELTNDQLHDIWLKTSPEEWDFARAVIAADRAQQAASHAEELAAYELTVSKLRSQALADIAAEAQDAGEYTAPQAQPEQPRKERPDFIAGYMAGMADGKALRAQTERERAAKVCDDMKKAFVTAKFPTDYECSAAMNAAMKCATKIRELK